MTEDARFEEGAEAPLNLVARDAADLQVIAALVQDAVFQGSEISWQPKQRRFAILVNRFRWEDLSAAEMRGRPVERVRSVLLAEDVGKVASQGIGREPDTVYSLLSVDWQPAEDGAGRIVLTLAGDGAIAVDVEALELRLKDVTRPYVAPSHRAPHHPE
jgi:hypothetical protein